jgi:hypothetical protein
MNIRGLLRTLPVRLVIGRHHRPVLKTNDDFTIVELMSVDDVSLHQYVETSINRFGQLYRALFELGYRADLSSNLPADAYRAYVHETATAALVGLSHLVDDLVVAAPEKQVIDKHKNLLYNNSATRRPPREQLHR